MSVIHVDVVSATEEIYSGEAKCVFAPASLGEIGIYPMHVALISTLKPGEVRVETENGMESIFVSGGIIEVQPDYFAIGTPPAKTWEQITQPGEIASFKETIKYYGKLPLSDYKLVYSIDF